MPDSMSMYGPEDTKTRCRSVAATTRRGLLAAMRCPASGSGKGLFEPLTDAEMTFFEETPDQLFCKPLADELVIYGDGYPLRQ